MLHVVYKLIADWLIIEEHWNYFKKRDFSWKTKQQQTVYEIE
jgi:hypothetical protein